MTNSELLAMVFGGNPLAERAFRGHVAQGRHQEAFDLALVFAWQNTNHWKVSALEILMKDAGCKTAGLLRQVEVGARIRGMRVGPFVGMQLPALSDCLFGMKSRSPIDLMKVARKLSASDMDTDTNLSTQYSREKAKMAREIRASLTLDVIAREQARSANHQVIAVRGRANRLRASGRA